MIESVRAKNFQSLQDIDLDFGKFTVIVGASSSGKSALTRAIKAVTSNALHSDSITKGAKHSSVTLTTDGATVTIERTGNESSNYKVSKNGCEEPPYSKLNRSVPTQVTALLGITPSTKEVESINFAGQFDTPYLLKDGASSVARVLGELTNVSTIFSAVREASKRAKNASTVANLRKKDLDKIITQIADYSSVGQQAKQITAIEDKISECTRIDSRISLLKELLDRATMASQALSRIKEIPALPDIDILVKAQTNLNSFKDILREVAKSRQTIAEQTASIEAAESAIIQAEEELHQTLVAYGQCPTCNQEIP